MNNLVKALRAFDGVVKYDVMARNNLNRMRMEGCVTLQRCRVSDLNLGLQIWGRMAKAHCCGVTTVMMSVGEKKGWRPARHPLLRPLKGGEDD